MAQDIDLEKAQELVENVAKVILPATPLAAAVTLVEGLIGAANSDVDELTDEELCLYQRVRLEMQRAAPEQ